VQQYNIQQQARHFLRFLQLSILFFSEAFEG